MFLDFVLLESSVPFVCSQSIQKENILFFVFVGKSKYCIEHARRSGADAENVTFK